MTTINITTIPVGQRAKALSTLTEAFIADPVARWLFPNEQSYRRAFPAFAAAFAGSCFESGTAFAIDDFAGVSLWLQPGEEPDQEEVLSIIQREVTVEDHDHVGSVLEQMDAYHPEEAHWYLPLLGVFPTHQNQGLGSSLLQTVLDRCDGEGLPAYLEASSVTNLSLYRRHGFRQIGEIRGPSAPPLYPMLRNPF